MTDQHIDFERETSKSGEEILGFLTGYKYSHHFETVIELLMEYAQKSVDNAIICYSWLKNYCCIDIDSCRYDYHAEKILSFALRNLSEAILLKRMISVLQIAKV